MNYHRYSPIMDYLYKKASAAYIAAEGPPDPIVRSMWISNHIQENKLKMDDIVSSALMDITTNPRINEIRHLLSY